jgi:hypothetical protein
MASLLLIFCRKRQVKHQIIPKNIIKQFDLIIYPAWRKLHATRMRLHFDNVVVHNMQMIAQMMTEYNFRRLNNSIYSQDLAPCDFFLSVT